MSDPCRIQLRRTKGWKMPPNTVNVARPGPHGNPFKVGGYFKIGGGPKVLGVAMSCSQRIIWEPQDENRAIKEGYTLIRSRAQAVDWFKRYHETYPLPQATIDLLRGKNLACWCPLVDERGNPVPCHAAVLLELANLPPPA